MVKKLLPSQMMSELSPGLYISDALPSIVSPPGAVTDRAPVPLFLT